MHFKNINVYILIAGLFINGCDLPSEPATTSSDIQTDENGLNYWGHEYNDFGHAVVQTADGGYAVVGSQFNSTNNEDLYIVKFDSELNITSEKVHAGSATSTDATNAYLTYNSQANDLQQTRDGGYIAVGSTFNGTDLDVWVVKFTSDLTAAPSWETVITGVANSDDWGNSIQQMASGEYLICGTSYDATTGNDYDVVLWKVSGTGTYTAATDLLYTETVALNNGTHDYGNYAEQTSDGGYIIVGTSVAGITLTKLSSLPALDTSFGESVAAAADGGILTITAADEGTYVQQVEGGSYIVVGNTEAGTGQQSDVYINTVSSTGEIGTTPTTIGGAYNDKITCIRQTSDGGFVFTGSSYDYASENNVWVVKLTPALSTHWSVTYGGDKNDEGRSIYQTTDGGYIITGSTVSYDYDDNQSEIVLLKLKNDGTVDNIIGKLTESTGN